MASELLLWFISFAAVIALIGLDGYQPEHRYMRRKHLVDVTEIFRLLNGEKKYRLIKLALYCSMLFIVIYRLVTTAVLLLIEEDGTLETEIF